MTNWGIAQIWNSSFEREEREPRKRSNLWASELGKAPIDIILSMQGEPVTNPPNPRSLRKFEAGNIWEWIMELILMRAGILTSSQQKCAYQYPGLLEVTGKADFIAGGIPDVTKANLEELHMPEIFIKAGSNIISYLEEKYPEGLPEQPIEIKSCSAYMFEIYEKKQAAADNHRIQLFHYLKSMDYDEGIIVYISRDDCRMLEVVVDHESEDEYKGYIENLTNWYNSDELPPKESEIVYDQELKKFQRNWKIAYSMYLKKLYGYESQKEYEDKYSPMVARFNRVLGRAIEGKEMTEKNKEIIKEIESQGFNFNELL
jgi:hypothetical protein